MVDEAQSAGYNAALRAYFLYAKRHSIQHDHYAQYVCYVPTFATSYLHLR